MATNLFINPFQNTGEQNLIEDLIIESIKIYGLDVFYMPRTLVAEDDLFGDDVLSKFENAYQIEMYIKSVDGFEGDGDFLSKFGLEIRDTITLTVARRRFSEEIVDTNTTPVNEDFGIGRPSEGDLIYLPLNGKIFEVKFVEHEAIFYQMGSLQTFDLRCDLFEYSHERFDTGIPTIDNIETNYSADKKFFEILMEDQSNTYITFEDASNGGHIVQEGYAIENSDSQANNNFFETQSTDIIDFSEGNPFSEGGRW